MKSLIIGKGQVGSSLYEVISKHHETYIKDVEELDVDGVEILHLCYPYTESFIETANVYIRKYQPKLTINHASVPVGTTENLAGHYCYSPIRGKHPNLAKGIETFDKFIAGHAVDVYLAQEYFKQCGVNTVCLPHNEIKSLEFSKLMTNIRYGYEIAFMQEAERIADELKANIDVFKLFEASYNIGYHKLGEDYMIRPTLYGGIIGGHCVMHNADIISNQVPSEMIDWMRFSNTKKIVQLENEEKKNYGK